LMTEMVIETSVQYRQPERTSWNLVATKAQHHV
jgi:hypothetical protein